MLTNSSVLMHRKEEYIFLCTSGINPRPVRAFLNADGRGSYDTPGDWPLMVVELREKKTFDASRRDLAIPHIVFGPR